MSLFRAIYWQINDSPYTRPCIGRSIIRWYSNGLFNGDILRIKKGTFSAIDDLRNLLRSLIDLLMHIPMTWNIHVNLLPPRNSVLILLKTK